MSVVGIDHVLLAMPPGREDEARAFYTGVMLLQEKVKPVELAGPRRRLVHQRQERGAPRRREGFSARPQGASGVRGA